MRVAIYAGTFDPITRGHLSVVERAAAAFDRVIVLIAINPDKRPVFDVEERLELIRDSTAQWPNVSCDSTREFVVYFARAHGARYLVRGIRGTFDVDAEMKLAHANHELAPEIETVFLPAHPGQSEVSSSKLKELVRRGEDVSAFCPPHVERRLRERLASTAPFEVVVLGVGDAFTRRHVTTSLLLTCDGVHLGIDCPDRYGGALQAAAKLSGRAIGLEDVDHLLLTHVHGDHVNGLEGAAFFKHFVQQRRLKLLTSPELRATLWEQRLRAAMATLWDGQVFREKSFDDYFEDLPLSWTDAVVVGPFRIRARRTKHHVPTSALLVSAAGRTLGYSADTAFDADLVDWLSKADLVLHETNHGPAHSDYEKLAALPESLRAKMRLVHYPDGFEETPRAIELAREGDLYKP